MFWNKLIVCSNFLGDLPTFSPYPSVYDRNVLQQRPCLCAFIDALIYYHYFNKSRPSVSLHHFQTKHVQWKWALCDNGPSDVNRIRFPLAQSLTASFQIDIWLTVHRGFYLVCLSLFEENSLSGIRILGVERCPLSIYIIQIEGWVVPQKDKATSHFVFAEILSLLHLTRPDPTQPGACRQIFTLYYSNICIYYKLQRVWTIWLSLTTACPL